MSHIDSTVSFPNMETLYRDVKLIIESARNNAIRSVDSCRVQMYWNLGKRIFEEEQQGKDRADYGMYLIRNLASVIEPEFGSGFSVRQLEQSRQFYRTYPNANTLRSQLNWSQYRRLIQIDDPDKREYYELESVNNYYIGMQLKKKEYLKIRQKSSKSLWFLNFSDFIVNLVIMKKTWREQLYHTLLTFYWKWVKVFLLWLDRKGC